jgi:hypothetical protein
MMKAKTQQPIAILLRMLSHRIRATMQATPHDCAACKERTDRSTECPSPSFDTAVLQQRKMETWPWFGL